MERLWEPIVLNSVEKSPRGVLAYLVAIGIPLPPLLEVEWNSR